MRLLETGSRLVLRDTARPLRVLGGAFVCSGLFVLTTPWTMRGWDTLSTWQRLATLGIGLSHLAGGLWCAMDPPATHVELDRATGDGELRFLRAWSRRAADDPPPLTRFRLADVRDVAVVQAQDPDGDPVWSLRLVLADGRALPLQSQPVHGEARARAWAERVRAFVASGVAA